MPDWQPCTMRFFCYQEQQGISSLGFPESLHQCLSEKLHPSQGCSGLGFLRENNYWDSNETPHWRSCENHTFSVKKSPEAGNPSYAAGWGNLQVGTDQPGLGRVQVRVRGKDPMLFGMLRTTFLFLEQIHSFWMGFTEQNASGWEPTKPVI